MESEVKARLRVVGEAAWHSSLKKADQSLKSTGTSSKSLGADIVSSLGKTGATGALAGLGSAAASAGSLILTGLVKGIEILITTAAAGSAALIALGIASSHVAGDFESAKMGLEAVLGSTKSVNLEWLRLREIAKLPGLGLLEAAQGLTKLMASGLSLNLSERSLKAFGNALATVGKGKADLDGVTLALSQMASKGVISAEEINQIAERVPQIRKAMQAAFGTADTETLQKMGITPDGFLEPILKELEKLPAVTGGIKNAFENMGDTISIAMASAGDVINKYLGPALEHIGSVISFLTESNVFSGFAERMMMVGQSFVEALGGKESLLRGVFMVVAVFEKIPDLVSTAGHAIIALGQQMYDIFTFPLKAVDALAAGIERLTGTKIPRLSEMLLMPLNGLIPGLSGIVGAGKDFGASIGSRADDLLKMFGTFESGAGKKAIPSLADVQKATTTPVLSSTLPDKPEEQKKSEQAFRMSVGKQSGNAMAEMKRFVIGGGERAQTALSGYQLGGNAASQKQTITVNAGSRQLNAALAEMFQDFLRQQRRVEGVR